MTRIRAAVNAFWHPPAGQSRTYADNRLDRYGWYWAMYWNTAYDNMAAYIAKWPSGAKLYRYTRGLRNPVGRWVDFYVANIWGGTLDLDAGDGTAEASALPIITENDALRPALAKVWQWSNWNAKRSLATMYSSALGDVVLKVVDSPRSQKAYIQVWWPGDFTELTWDDFGHVKRAVIEYDVEDGGLTYAYKEVIEHPTVWGGSRTRFSTYKDNRPFGYEENGGREVWEVPYDFVPVVHIPWRDVGQAWGAVGFAKAVKKIDAANALASQLADQIGKAVNTPLVAFGITPTSISIQADQDGVPVMWVPSPDQNTRIEPLISDLDLTAALAALQDQVADIQEDLPELKMAESLRSGMSGEALGRAFSDIMAQVQAVRATHDSGLVRAHQMAIAIAGQFQYAPEFAGFDLASYRAGQLDHGIASRPVLPRSHEEEFAELERRWQLVAQLISSGTLPHETALREIMLWTDEQLAEFGQQRLAAIQLEQEDMIPETEQ